MAVLTDLGEARFLNVAFNGGLGNSALYLGLSATAFADDDDATTAYAKEPNTGNYARVEVTFDNGTEATRSITNSDPVVFPTASASWGTLGYWCLFNADDNTGLPMAHGALSATRTVGDGDSVQVPAGSLILSLSSNWATWFSDAVLREFVGNDGNLTLPTTHQLGVATSAFIMNGNPTYDYGAIRPADPDGNLTTEERENLLLEPWGTDVSGITKWNTPPAVPGGGVYYELYTSGTTGYTRTTLDIGGASTTAGVTTAVNTNDMVYPQAESDWGSIGYWAIFGAADPSLWTATEQTEYNNDKFYFAYPLVSGSFTTAKTVNTGDVLRVNIGDFVLEAT